MSEDCRVSLGTLSQTPNPIIFSCLPGTEIMRLDMTGMTYKGQRIEDGGEAHKAFMETMRVLSFGAGLSVGAAGGVSDE